MTRDEAQALLRRLGFEPEHVESLTLTGDGIAVRVSIPDAHGNRPYVYRPLGKDDAEGGFVTALVEIDYED